MSAKWYIVHAYSNFEKKVAEAIRAEARAQGLEERFEDDSAQAHNGTGHQVFPFIQVFFFIVRSAVG